MDQRDSKQEYEATWAGLAEVIERQIAAGVTNAAEIAKAATAHEGQFSTQPAFQHYLGRSASPLRRLAVEDGAYTAKPISWGDPGHIEILADCANERRFTHIVELGSGIGRNLFLLREALLAAGATVPSLHACEYTEAGRAATRRLAEVELIPVGVHAFDYRQPDLSFLPAGASVLFFSSHSLEQVTVAPVTFIDEMLARSAGCVCYHFEPVGWQLDERLLAWRSSRDSLFGAVKRKTEWLGWKVLRAANRIGGLPVARGFQGIPRADVALGVSRNVSRNGARWSARLHYNRNLVPLLREQEAKGRIRIFRLEPNVWGETPFNPTTVIGWEKL